MFSVGRNEKIIILIGQVFTYTTFILWWIISIRITIKIEDHIRPPFFHFIFDMYYISFLILVRLTRWKIKIHSDSTYEMLEWIKRTTNFSFRYLSHRIMLYSDFWYVYPYECNTCTQSECIPYDPWVNMWFWPHKNDQFVWSEIDEMDDFFSLCID